MIPVHRSSQIDLLGLDRRGYLLSTDAAMPRLSSSSQRARLFKSARLEKLTLMSPRMFVGSWLLLLSAIVWVGWNSASFMHAGALIIAGLFAWTLFEYAMHRFPFHYTSERSVLNHLVFLMHGNHHDNPGDEMRNLMPLVVSLPIASLVWIGSLALAGAPGTWLFFGWISGYIIYDLLHYACHQWPMKSRIGSALKRHHMRHHYVDEGGNYAISMILWDRVFGTRINTLRR